MSLCGCRTPGGPAITERVEHDGTITRIELAEEAEQKEQVKPEVLQARMEAYRRARATGALHPDLRASWHPMAAAFDPFTERGCPPEGSASATAKEASNRRKNRISKPVPSDIDPAVTFSALRAPGKDRNRWSADRGAVIEGYVRSAKPTDGESCNCGETNKDLTDTHVDMVADSSDRGMPIIVEITPPMRLLHAHAGLEDWSSKAIKAKYEGHRVRVTGWLFFDADHLNEADNTDPGDKKGKKNWRASCWEIHPITDIELLD